MTRNKKIELEQVKSQLDQVAWLLDNAFKIPGVNWRFGIEALIGLIPGAGDILTGSIGIILLFRALQFKLPRIVILRMIINSVLDITIGAIPFIGDLFDFIWKSNTRNMNLFRQYAEEPARSTKRHWIFLSSLLAGFVLLLGAIVFLFVYFIQRIFGN